MAGRGTHCSGGGGYTSWGGSAKPRSPPHPARRPKRGCSPSSKALGAWRQWQGPDPPPLFPVSPLLSSTPTHLPRRSGPAHPAAPPGFHHQGDKGGGDRAVPRRGELPLRERNKAKPAQNSPQQNIIIIFFLVAARSQSISRPVAAGVIPPEALPHAVRRASHCHFFQNFLYFSMSSLSKASSSSLALSLVGNWRRSRAFLSASGSVLLSRGNCGEKKTLKSDIGKHQSIQKLVLIFKSINSCHSVPQ